MSTLIDGFELRRMLDAEADRLRGLARDDNLSTWGQGRLDGIEWARSNANLLIGDEIDKAEDKP